MIAGPPSSMVLLIAAFAVSVVALVTLVVLGLTRMVTATVTMAWRRLDGWLSVAGVATTSGDRRSGEREDDDDEHEERERSSMHAVLPGWLLASCMSPEAASDVVAQCLFGVRVALCNP